MKINKAVSKLLLLGMIIMIVSGYGISNPRLLNSWTFGLIERGDAFSIHSFFAIPVIILLILHVFPLYKVKKIFRGFEK